METKKTFEVGKRVVIFNYTNSSPLAWGTIISQTENFIEIRKDGFYGKAEWYPKSNAEQVI